MKKEMASISSLTQDIVEEFALLRAHPEMMLHYLMEHGRMLTPLAEKERRKEDLLQGCLSQVWLVGEGKDGKLYLRGASDALVTQGLMSLLLRIYSGQACEKILVAPFDLPEKLHLQQFIGTRRSGGFALMWQKIQEMAMDYAHSQNGHR